MSERKHVAEKSHRSDPAAAGAAGAQPGAAPTAPTAGASAAMAGTEPAMELAALRAEIAALQDKNLRLLAESRNQRQRAERETEEARRYAESAFARELLVVIDDLERTQQSVAEGAGVQALADGVRIVYEHFIKVLRSRGIETIAAVGTPFDPDRHEALLQQPSAEYPAGTVMQELARGYTMHQRVIRPARVIISSGPPTSGAAFDDADGAADSEDA